MVSFDFVRNDREHEMPPYHESLKQGNNRKACDAREKVEILSSQKAFSKFGTRIALNTGLRALGWFLMGNSQLHRVP